MKEKECNLCRRCVGICRKTVGIAAISYVELGNGQAQIVFAADRCIACGSCAYICDTGMLTLEDIGGTRIMTIPGGRMEFKLRQCKKCGSYWAPERQLEYIAEKANLPREVFDLCIDCRE
jgi:ferredoxin